MNDAAEIIATRLAELWQTSRPMILERITLLRDASTALASNADDQEARSSGREAAHKLSGVLGVFGLPQGSEIAAEIEELLKSSAPLAPDNLAWLHGRVADLDFVIASRSRQ